MITGGHFNEQVIRFRKVVDPLERMRWGPGEPMIYLKMMLGKLGYRDIKVEQVPVDPASPKGGCTIITAWKPEFNEWIPETSDPMYCTA